MTERLPRVTEVLDAVGLGPDLRLVPPDVLEAARKRGSAVHEAIEALSYGYLDGLDPAIAPFVDAYRSFVADSDFKAVATEIEIVHPVWRYVGHPDQVGWLRGRRAMLDFKSGEDPDLGAARYQLAAYRCAWNAARPAEPVDLTAVLQLRECGRYTYHDIAAVPAEQTWLAALLVYRARLERSR